MSKDFILIKEDAISDEACSYCKVFFDKFVKHQTPTEYGEGQNTKTSVLSVYKDNMYLKDPEFHEGKRAFIAYMRPILDDCINKLCVDEFSYLKGLLKENRLHYSIFQLRTMFGPTRSHSDNLDPLVAQNGEDTDVYARVATLILTLSESDDVLHFPYQNKEVPLTKGSLLLFPPYWNYLHYSTHGSKTTRFCFQTWVLERITERDAHLKEQSIL